MEIQVELGRWQGYIELIDPLPMFTLAVFEESASAAFAIDPKLGKAKAHKELIPALLQCVSEWKIEGFPENPTLDTFPGAGKGMSKVDIAILINFIVGKILKLIEGKDPNE
jgi:hypothetical protein